MQTSPKKIGLLSMIFLCLNGMVGSGLFLLPGQVAHLAGKWALVVFIAVAILITALGWCYIQCASHFTKNGGAYLYAKTAFGDFVGFQVGLMRWFVGMIAWASLTCGLVVSLVPLFPEAANYKNSIAVMVIFSLTVLNLFGASVVKKLNNVITVTKVLLIISFVVFGSYAMKLENIVVPFEEFPQDLFGAACLIVFFAFSGFEAIAVVAQELENPKKNIPRAMITGIAFCSLLYFAVQLICIGALGNNLALSSSPIADVAHVAFGNYGKAIVSLAMILSIGGVTIVSSFITPRSGAVVAEDHPIFSKIVSHNRFDAPYMAIIISCLISTIIALSGGFLELVKVSVVSRFVQHTATCLSLFVFHKKGIIRPFQNKLKMAIPIFAILCIFWLLAHADLYHVFLGFGALFLGVPLYLIQMYLDKKQTQSVKIDL